MTRRGQPRGIGDAIRAARADAAPATPLAAVQGVWRETVGARIADRAWPLREREGVVTVGCAAATWAQELDLLQGELLTRLNAALSPRELSGLRFVVDPEQDHP